MRHLSDKYINEIKEKRSEFRKNTQKLIEDGIQQGEFKQGLHPDIITMGILGITNWSYYWFNPDGEQSEEQVVEIFVNMILNGIYKMAAFTTEK